jgi:hypothetical protein
MGLIGAVGDRGTDDDRVADHGWRRRDLVIGEARRWNSQSSTKIDDALLAETGNGRPGPRIERDETRVDRGDDDATVSAALPRGDTAAGEIAVPPIPGDFRVIDPPLLSC